MAVVWALHVIFLILGEVQVAASAETLKSYNIDTSETTVSGFSSGAIFAIQMHIAMSGTIKGVGAFTAWPFACAQGLDAIIGGGVCSLTPASVDIDYLESQLRGFESSGRVDSLDNLKGSKVYIQGGASDPIVTQGSTKKARDLYERLDVDLKTEFDMDTAHVVPTVDFGGGCNDVNSGLIFGACQYNGAKELLEHLLGDLEDGTQAIDENFHAFDQQEFYFPADWGGMASMDNSGIVYVPSKCAAGEECVLHVHMHGCTLGKELVGDSYYKNAGFNEIAEANNIIILYPQVKTSLLFPINISGCYDIWGYNSDITDILRYTTKTGRQMTGIYRMIYRMQSEGNFGTPDEDDDNEDASTGDDSDEDASTGDNQDEAESSGDAKNDENSFGRDLHHYGNKLYLCLAIFFLLDSIFGLVLRQEHHSDNKT